MNEKKEDENTLYLQSAKSNRTVGYTLRRISTCI